MRAHIIYFNFLKPDGEGMSVGGIQTYIVNLIPVLRQCGYEVTVYQRSVENFHKTFEDYDVYGVSHKNNHSIEVSKALLEKAMQLVNKDKDLLLYGCETCITRKVDIKTIAIQHGISWDKPMEKCSSLQYFSLFVRKSHHAWNIINRVKKVDTLVCVDYNFINWYRAVSPYIKAKAVAIPNFTVIPTRLCEKNNKHVNIIFARRFFTYRGTRLFANATEKLLREFDNIHITIAGEGPDAEYIHKKLDSFSNVNFITYESNDSIRIHSDKDIAVIPTLGSEGTSLSLLEAMASGCAVICTNVGGMANIVLDGYNGLSVSPDEMSLYTAMRRLTSDRALRAKLQDNAYKTVKEAFSIEIWQERWKHILQK